MKNRTKYRIDVTQPNRTPTRQIWLEPYLPRLRTDAVATETKRRAVALAESYALDKTVVVELREFKSLPTGGESVNSWRIGGDRSKVSLS